MFLVNIINIIRSKRFVNVFGEGGSMEGGRETGGGSRDSSPKLTQENKKAKKAKISKRPINFQ